MSARRRGGAFRFEGSDHTYWLGSQKLAGVTDSLACARLQPPVTAFMRRFRDRGKKVHQACALIEQGGLSWADLDPKIAGWVEAYCRWREESGFVPLATELSGYDEVYGFGFTLDVAGILHGEPAIVDRKTVSKIRPAEWWVGYQTAGYRRGFADTIRREQRPPVRSEVERWARARRYALMLDGTGDYKLQEFTDWRDESRFLAAVTICQAREEREGPHHEWKTNDEDAGAAASGDE